MEVESKPAPGSVSEKHWRSFSPEAIPGSTSRFIDSEP
jgi:hypothetical protein